MCPLVAPLSLTDGRPRLPSCREAPPVPDVPEDTGAGVPGRIGDVTHVAPFGHGTVSGWTPR